MQKKLTIMIEEDVYDGLYRVVGPRKMGKFIERIIRPHVVRENLDSAYQAMAEDEARETEALEWAEGTLHVSEEGTEE